MTSQGENPGPSFLTDTPVREDEFGGGHRRVAQALADITVHKEGGRSIALRGPYGSGKSTVVRLLRDELNERQREGTDDIETRIFIYDAWEHRGDPLRRSFIEDFIDFVEDSEYDWSEKGDWEKERNMLSGREETIDTTVEPRLTWPGRLTAASLLLVPLGYTLFRQVGNQDGGSFLSVPLWGLGLLLTLLPFLIALGTYICWRPWRRAHRRLVESKLDLDDFRFRDFFRHHRPPYHKSSVFNLFVREKRKEITTEKIQTPDPTSIEFRSIFHTILDEILGDKNRKIIVVVDNLDRLSSERALSAWATMRTFFDRDDHDGYDWFDRFWLVVPFDFNALKRIWNNEDGTVQETDGSSENRIQKQASSSDKFRAFVDKTFQITFRVAPPVRSDWKSFFIDQLEDAFSELASKEETGFHTVYRLYQLENRPGSNPPTPRDIKIFINHLVAHYQQWKDVDWDEEDQRVPLPLIALYESKKGTLRGSAEKLTDQSFLSPDVESLVRQWKWRRGLAALHFNVKPNSAIQILIGDEVESALADGDVKALKDREHVEGFYPVLSRSIRRVEREGKSELIAAAARTLDECEFEVNPSVSESWQWLRIAARKVNSWVPYSENVGPGIVAILDHTPKPEIDELCSRVSRSFTEVNDEVEPEHWVDAAIPVARAIDSRNRKTLEDEFWVPGTPDFFVDALTRLVREHVTPTEEIIHYFTPSIEPSNIIDTLNELCSDGKFTSVHPDVIWGMKRVREDGKSISWEWKPLLDTLSKRIRWDVNVTGSEEVYGNLMSLIVLAEHHEVERAGALLSNNNGIDSCFHHLYKTQDDPRLSATCVLALLIYNPKGQSGSGNGKSNDGRTFFNGEVLGNYKKHDELVYTVAQITINYNLLGRMLESTQVARQKTRGFVECIAGYIAEETEGSQDERFGNFDAQILCDYANRIVPGILDTLDDLVSHLHRQGRLLQQLRTYSEAQWYDVLKVDGGRLDIVISLVNQRIDPDLPSAFADALREHAGALLDEEEVEVHRPQQEWILLLEAVSEESKATFLRDMRDRMLQLDRPVGTLMNLYGDVLVEKGILAEEADQVVRSLFTPIIGRGDVKELKSLRNVLKRNGIMKKAEEASRATFKGRVREKYGESSGQVREGLEEIAALVGVELPDESNGVIDSDEASSEEG